MKFGLTALAAAVFLGGCGSASETSSESPPPVDEFTRYVRENEATFEPSDYGIESWDSVASAGVTTSTDESFPPEARTEADTIPGFRVQVVISQEIDRANSLRDSLSRAMPGERIYIVHHPPYYKVRIGNYADRFAAGETLDRLRRHGLADAWVVPDRIITNMPSAPTVPDSTQPETEDPSPH